MTTQNNPTTKPRRRKAVDSFLHDSNARNDQKVLRLRARGGWQYYGIYWAVIEVLRESSNYKLEHDALEAVALSLSIRDQDFVTFISTACQVGLLVQDEVGYYSPALLDRMNRYEETIEKRKQAGSKGGAVNAARLELVRSNEVANATPIGIANERLNNNSNLIQSNTNSGSDPERAREEEPAPVAPPPDDELEARILAFADRHLLPGSNPQVAGNNLWILQGKRPMRKYPDVWITPHHLFDTLTTYVKAGIPEKELHIGFRLVDAHISAAKAQGRSPTSICAYSWLIGHGLRQSLEQYGRTLNVQRQEKYLKNAGAK